jgi:hypothetical protein
MRDAEAMDGIEPGTGTRPDRTPLGPRDLDAKRAAQLFVIDEWGTESAFVEKAWSSHSVPEPSFISVAQRHWQMVITTQRDMTTLTIRGPETTATMVPIPEDAGFFGITFRLGSFMPRIPLVRLVDRAVTWPTVSPKSVWLAGSRWEVPTSENADVFVDRLVREGLVVSDRAVAEWMHGDAGGLSTRTLQRRVMRSTGLTRVAIKQIARAEQAVDALTRGLAARDVAHSLGYADQAHLARSLKRFMGQTPRKMQATSSPASPRDDAFLQAVQ